MLAAISMSEPEQLEFRIGAAAVVDAIPLAQALLAEACENSPGVVGSMHFQHELACTAETHKVSAMLRGSDIQIGSDRPFRLRGVQFAPKWSKSAVDLSDRTYVEISTGDTLPMADDLIEMVTALFEAGVLRRVSVLVK